MKLAALVAGLSLALAGAAHANSYTVTSCAAQTAGSGWTAQNTAPGVLSITAACPDAGLSVAGRVGAPSAAHGQSAAWTLAAPPTLRISRLTVERYLGVTAEGWIANVSTAEGAELERCERPWWAPECTRGTGEVTFAGLSTPSLSFRVACVTQTSCPNGRASASAWLAIYAATATVEDPAPPAVQRLTGSILEPGWHRGTDTATVSAGDASGIKRLRLLAGTTELGRSDQRCDYARMQPCPSQATTTFRVDVRDGTHQLRAVATDAADQEAASVATLRVDRTAPTPPAELTATPAADGSFTVAWTNPDQGTAAPIVAAHYAVCGDTCGPTETVRGRDIERIEGVRWGEHTLQLWLEDEAGNVDRTQAGALAFDAGARPAVRVVDVNPPVLLPSGPAPSPRLRITKARRNGARLTLSGTIARPATARITARAKRGRATARASAKPRRGKWSLKLRLTPDLRRAGAMSVTVRYGGQADLRSATVRRRLVKRGGRAGTEFSIEGRR